jgi:hypothetical protein
MHVQRVQLEIIAMRIPFGRARAQSDSFRQACGNSKDPTTHLLGVDLQSVFVTLKPA